MISYEILQQFPDIEKCYTFPKYGTLPLRHGRFTPKVSDIIPSFADQKPNRFCWYFSPQFTAVLRPEGLSPSLHDCFTAGVKRSEFQWLPVDIKSRLQKVLCIAVWERPLGSAARCGNFRLQLPTSTN